MTVKQRAALQTFLILAGTITVSLITTLILREFTVQEIVTGLSVASVVFLIYSMYGVILSRLEYKEHLNKMVDKTAK